MKKIIVTGATGFIGKRLVKQLTEQFSAERILCLVYDVDIPQERLAVEYLDSLGVETSRVDLVSGRGLDKAPESVGMVFHLAASTHTENHDHRCNDIGTANLLKYLDSASSPLHIVFASTMALYDDRKDTHQPINEDRSDDIRPKSEYGRTKLRAENLLKQTCLAKGFGLTILRFATVYGKGVRANGMFDTLCHMMRRGSIIPRLNWPGRIAMVHVDDCVEAMCALGEQPPSPVASETYIMCSENLTLSEIAERIYSAHTKPYRIINFPRIFWRLLALVTRQKKWMEPFLPHRIYNKLWQLDLVVTSHMYSDGSKLRSRLPAWGTRKFNEAVYEVVNKA